MSTPLAELIQLKEEYKQKLENINEQIANHPDTIRENVSKGLETLNGFISDSDYHITTENGFDVKNYLLKFEKEREDGFEDYRPGFQTSYTFVCSSGFEFKLHVEVPQHHEECWVKLRVSIENNDFSKWYDLEKDHEYNFTRFVEDLSNGGNSVNTNIAELEIFKPFFKLDYQNVYECSMYDY